MVGGDVDEFCEHAMKTVESLKAIYGVEDQTLNKIYKTLLETHIASFNEYIRVSKTVTGQSRSSTPTTFGLIKKHIASISHKLYTENGLKLAKQIKHQTKLT